MARTLDKVKIEKVKQARLRGKKKGQALLDAGYSENTAKHEIGRNKTLKHVDDLILQELKEKDVTVELIINRLNEDRELARAKKDIATMKECDKLLGDYLSMFKSNGTLKLEITQTEAEKEELSNLRNRVFPSTKLT